MRVDTGEVLVMANAPGFDPNDPGAADADDRGNRAVGEIFEPGLDVQGHHRRRRPGGGRRSPRRPRTRSPTPSSAAAPGSRTPTRHAVERLTVAGILAESSNVGHDPHRRGADQRAAPRLVRRLRLRPPDRPRPAGGVARACSPTPATWSGSQRYTVMFGQGVSVNAMQIASVFQTIANDGVRVEPSVVVGTRDVDGDAHAAPDRARPSASSPPRPRPRCRACSSPR